MPRRLIDSRLFQSKKFCSLPKNFDRVLYVYLLANTDPHGREEGDSTRAFAQCGSLLGETEKSVEESMLRLHEVGLILLYESDGNRFYEITRFDDFQNFNGRNRGKASKYPHFSESQLITVNHCESLRPYCNINKKKLNETKNTSCSGITSDSPNQVNVSKPKYEEKHMELARHLARLIKDNCPKNITIKKEQGPQWADTFRLMEKYDGPEGKGIHIDEIKAVIDWAFKDDFWRTQIQSAGAVRKHWNKLVAKKEMRKEKQVQQSRFSDDMEWNNK